MKRKSVILVLVCCLFLAGIGIAQAEESISGLVISVHYSPGIFLQVIVQFADGQTKIFKNNRSVREIIVGKFITIYYENENILKIERPDSK